MDSLPSPSQLAVGSELYGPVRKVTPERIEWYDSGMLTAGRNERTQVGVNIHTSEEYAREQGLPSANADGMISTNWCSSMLLRYFGMDYIERGELRTKYIRPVPVGAVVHVRGKVTGIDSTDSGAIYKMDIWCENEASEKLVVGDAKVEVRNGR